MIRAILKSLLKPEAYPEPTHSVELLQTHVSWIFLTDKHAYKVKKPVNFGFLNFQPSIADDFTATKRCGSIAVSARISTKGL